MNYTKPLLDQFATRNGWSIETMLELVCEYVDAQGDLGGFEGFLREKEATGQEQSNDKMQRAFDLVSPLAMAERLVKAGKLASVGEVTWRDPIDAVVLDDDLEREKLTISDVVEAVAYHTATVAEVERVTIRVKGEIKREGYRVRAVGYRMGPAGP